MEKEKEKRFSLKKRKRSEEEVEVQGVVAVIRQNPKVDLEDKYWRDWMNFDFDFEDLKTNIENEDDFIY